MDSLSSKFLISSAPARFPATYSINRRRNLKFGTNFQISPLIVRSKRSSYQDFQEYAKPSRLLPATELKVFNDASIENLSTSFVSGEYKSLYKVKIETSKNFGSGLSDVNSGILLCLIDENGSSLLLRLPATKIQTRSEDTVVDDTLHFQRGSVDEFAFVGPNLGKIVAVWLSLESGQWRIGGMSLIIVCHRQPSPAKENNENSKQLTGLQYNFEFEDILLGEKSETPMMEFKPHSITSFSDDESNVFNSLSASSSSFDAYIASNEESMKDYSNLKFSLLLYDAALIFAGSTIAYYSTGGSAPYAFMTGGVFGFFYLLLLQRSVDGISSQEFVSSETKGSFGRVFGSLNLKGPISSLVLAFAFAIVALKYASGGDAVKLTPKDVVFGMLGFLMCKVSVVLAAFKPVPISLGDNE